MGAENIVEGFLLGAIVFAFTGHAHAQQVPIKAQTRLGVADDNRRVINAHKEVLAWIVPFGQAFLWGEPQNLQNMVIRIAKVKRFDATRILVPGWQGLRAAAGEVDLVLAKPGIRGIHVAYDDGDVLDPAIL